MNIKEQKFFNPKSGRLVGYYSAKVLGLLPQNGSISVEAPKIKQSEIKVETVKISDLNFDSKIFEPVKTGNRHLDLFISTDGGFMPATNIIMIGTPGIGKTTVGLNFLTRIKKKGKKVLFISGEMGRIDMYRYSRRYKEFADLDILFLSDYADSDPQYAIEKALEKGYDVVLGDSWAEISDAIQDVGGVSKKRAESWILDLMQKHNEGNNEAKLYTCFIMIQQVTKNGVFLGTNRLKHMTSAMLELNKDRENNINVMEFTKNRVGVAGERVSFRLNSGTIAYAKVDN